MLLVRQEILNPVIKVKYHVPGMPDIRQAHEGEWYDLYTAERVVFHVGDYKKISLGVSMQLPDGYEAMMASRSSLFDDYGIFNPGAIGVMDHIYMGDDDIWHFPAYCLKLPEGKSVSVIPQFTRICQFRIFPEQMTCTRVTVETLGNANRGGFGSTGRS